MYETRLVPDELKAIKANLDTNHPSYAMPAEGVCLSPTSVPSPSPIAPVAPTAPAAAPPIPSPVPVTLEPSPPLEELVPPIQATPTVAAPVQPDEPEADESELPPAPGVVPVQIP